MFRLDPKEPKTPPDNSDAETCTHDNPKTVVVVTVVRVVPVAVGAASVPLIVPVATAAQHAVPLSLAPQPKP